MSDVELKKKYKNAIFEKIKRWVAIENDFDLELPNRSFASLPKPKKRKKIFKLIDIILKNRSDFNYKEFFGTYILLHDYFKYYDTPEDSKKNTSDVAERVTKDFEIFLQSLLKMKKSHENFHNNFLEGTGQSVTTLATRIDSYDLPSKVKRQCRELLKEFEKDDNEKSKAALKAILNFPWNAEAPEIDVTPKEAKEKLNESHYGLEKVKDHIVEYLAVLQTKNLSSIPCLCLVGPPGTGKTSIARQVSEILNRQFRKINVGGMKNPSMLNGSDRHFVGAHRGKLVKYLSNTDSRSPVILIDEIDKIPKDARRNPESVLLETIDPEENDSFHDRFLDVDIPLDQVIFIATANRKDAISKPLLDRMEVEEIQGYSTDEKIEIAKNYIVPDLLDEYDLSEDEFVRSPSMIEKIVHQFSDDSGGVRTIQKKFDRLARQRLVDHLNNDSSSGSDNNQLQGPEIVEDNVAEESIQDYDD